MRHPFLALAGAWPASLLGALFLLITGTAFATGPSSGTEWRFTVHLGEREIGQHRFRIQPNNGALESRSEANLNVKILKVNAFTYVHEATERWNGDCLERIESRTDSNGRPYEVVGRLGTDAFHVRTRTANAELPPCVMSFAYWNPKILQQQRLLNSQTGELVDVRIETKGAEQIQAGGAMRSAQRYAIIGRKLSIDVWYGPDGRWLGLESITDGGHKLRYVLQ